MLRFICKLLALFRLPTIHSMGWLLGWIVHYCNPNAARLQRDNLLQSNLVKNSSQLQRLIKSNIAETGKAFIETLAIWGKAEHALYAWVKQVDGWNSVQNALEKGKGIIFLTPHMG